MPSNYLHKKISKILTGKSHGKTNEFIDYPFRILGRKHRILFHDPFSATLLGFLFEGSDGAVAGLLHVVVDYYSSNYPFLRKILEYLL